MTLLREEWDHIAQLHSPGELDEELNLLGELRWELSQLIAAVGERKRELRRVALGARLRRILGRR